MIGRIEREDFIPSIIQFEALGKVLDFDITQMFLKRKKQILLLHSEVGH